jgi:hypothetical protein
MESRAGRFLEASAWIVGLVAVAFFGGVYPLLSGSRTYTAEEIGRIFGAMTGALLIGLFVSPSSASPPCRRCRSVRQP